MSTSIAPNGPPIGITTPKVNPTTPPAPPVESPSVVSSKDVRSPSAPQAKQGKAEAPSGFNPSIKIDPDTHIVVMSISGPDGKVVRQIPNEHEMAAYKVSVDDARKSQY